jgi:hypothetical protein
LAATARVEEWMTAYRIAPAGPAAAEAVSPAGGGEGGGGGSGDGSVGPVLAELLTAHGLPQFLPALSARGVRDVPSLRACSDGWLAAECGLGKAHRWKLQWALDDASDEEGGAGRSSRPTSDGDRVYALSTDSARALRAASRNSTSGAEEQKGGAGGDADGDGDGEGSGLLQRSAPGQKNPNRRRTMSQLLHSVAQKHGRGAASVGEGSDDEGLLEEALGEGDDNDEDNADEVGHEEGAAALRATASTIGEDESDVDVGDHDDDDEEEASETSETSSGSDAALEELALQEVTLSVRLRVAGLEAMLLDDCLGLHLPVVKASLGELNFALANLPDDEAAFVTSADADLPFEALPVAPPMDLGNARQPSMGQIIEAPSPRAGPGALKAAADGAGAATSADKAVNLASDFRLWAEYFNSPLRCWEPLVELFSGRALVESCAGRGTGIVLKLDNPLHVNVTGALLDTMDDALRIVSHFTGSHHKPAGAPPTPQRQAQHPPATQSAASAGNAPVGLDSSGHGHASVAAEGRSSGSSSAARAAAGLFRGEEEHAGAGRRRSCSAT